MALDYRTVLKLPLSSRTMVVGTSGSGKSTLAEHLIALHMQSHPHMQALYIDSKPRFRAQYELNGITTKASKRYKAWSKEFGVEVPGSYVLPLSGDIADEISQVWRLGGRIAIAQGGRERWGDLMQAAEVLYNGSWGKVERLVYINEMSDFFEVKKIGGIFWLMARSGREKKVAMIAETQRPVYLPKTLLTEMRQLFLFELDDKDDMKAVYDKGVPDHYEPVKEKYTFFYWNKDLKETLPSGEYYQLKGIS